MELNHKTRLLQGEGGESPPSPMHGKGRHYGVPIYSLSDMMADDSPPPPDIIGDGIFPKDSLLLISGQPKTKKTMFALNVALGIAGGVSVAGFKIQGPQRVLYLSAEGGYHRTRDRSKRMARGLGISQTDNFLLLPSSKINFMDEDSLEKLKAVLDMHKPEVVVIDPMARFHDKEENSSTEMYAFLGRIRRLMEEYNFSVIMVHHQGKGLTRTPRGSSAILAEYDTGISMTSTKGKTTLAFDMRHAESLENRELVFNGQTLLFEDPTENLIVKILRDERSPLTRDELRSKLAKTGKYNDHSAYKPIQKAQKDGMIIPTADGKFTLPDHSSAKEGKGEMENGMLL